MTQWILSIVVTGLGLWLINNCYYPCDNVEKLLCLIASLLFGILFNLSLDKK